jgi:hypothetical protein
LRNTELIERNSKPRNHPGLLFPGGIAQVRFGSKAELHP